MKSNHLLVPFLVFGLIWTLLFVSVFSLQIIDHDTYEKKSRKDSYGLKNIGAKRGQITDRNGVVLADGVTKKKRVYLKGSLASQIMGVQGSSGLEYYYDSMLSGKDGFKLKVKKGIDYLEEKKGLGDTLSQVESGKDMVLSIDANIQEAVEYAIKKGYNEYSAQSVSAVVVDPFTGDILAAASYPTFDPNGSKTNSAEKKCGAFTFTYEPGSIFKGIVAAMALETNKVDTNKTFDAEGGIWKWNPKDKPVKEHNLKEVNREKWGMLTMREGLVKSSNIVYGKIAEEIGPVEFYRQARNMGFGYKSLHYYPGEEKGKLPNPKDYSGRTLLTEGFGHELMVTPVQMAMAYAAFANGGTLYAPRLVLGFRDGEIMDSIDTHVVRRVISENVAVALRDMLRDVVTSGTGKPARSEKLGDFLEFGGKTGTAELKDGSNTQNSSFIGFAPALAPRYVCLVVAERLKQHTKNSTGGSSSGVMFKNIMESIYFNPKTSPNTFGLSAANDNKKCEKRWIGMNLDKALALAEKNSCIAQLKGEGDIVVSFTHEAADSLTLTLGTERVEKMPDLVGMPLRDALKVLKDARLQVEFEGTGRVVKQSPEAFAKIERKAPCKLVLKEKV